MVELIEVVKSHSLSEDCMPNSIGLSLQIICLKKQVKISDFGIEKKKCNKRYWNLLLVLVDDLRDLSFKLHSNVGYEIE